MVKEKVWSFSRGLKLKLELDFRIASSLTCSTDTLLFLFFSHMEAFSTWPSCHMITDQLKSSIEAIMADKRIVSIGHEI